MKKIVTGLLLLMLNTGVFAIEEKSKLIVGITISNFYPEWLDIYKTSFCEGGFKKMMLYGKKTMADYNYMFSQTGVDHATIYTGMLPSSHGVVAHNWYDRLREKRRSNVINDTYRLLGEEGESGEGVAPDYMEALTLGGLMKMNNAFSKVYSIAANSEEAVLSGGAGADLAIWLGEKTGKWVTSSYYHDVMPTWLQDFNREIKTDELVKKGWMALADEENNKTAMKLKSKIGLVHGFYYDLMQSKRKYDTYKIVKATPYMNTLLVDLANEIIKKEQLGRDNETDLLTVNFSCLDYMNRDYDVYSREFEDVVLRLDRDLERLFVQLDQSVGRGNYVVFLTFSEARELLPKDLQRIRQKSGNFSIFKAVALLKSFMSLMYGQGEWVADYDATQIYLNRELVEKQKLSLKDMQDKIANFMVEFEGVSHVMTASALTHNSFAGGTGALFQHSFSQKKSGDVMYSLQNNFVSELKDREDYFARYSKRHNVPLYIYGSQIAKELQPECQMTDLLKELCKALKIPVPYSFSR